MSFIQWYDWIVPTNPYVAIFVGIIFTIFIPIMTGNETIKNVEQRIFNRVICYGQWYFIVDISFYFVKKQAKLKVEHY
ncbi:MAG TPA: hypothetical protein VF095_04170 [Bacillota bacterium]